MRIEQLQSLTEDELAMVLYIVNVLKPMEPKMEITPRLLTVMNHAFLVKKLVDSFNLVKPEAYPIYSSLLTKLGIDHKIEVKAPEAPPTASVSSEVSGSQ